MAYHGKTPICDHITRFIYFVILVMITPVNWMIKVCPVFNHKACKPKDLCKAFHCYMSLLFKLVCNQTSLTLCQRGLITFNIDYFYNLMIKEKQKDQYQPFNFCWYICMYIQLQSSYCTILLISILPVCSYA